MSLLSPVVFEGQHDGPHLLILGAVHGNEPCGHIAIGKVLDNIKHGNIRIHTGRVTFVQTCNPKAFEQNKRFVESNLNRRLFPKDNPETYEDHLGNELCPLLASADLLLDIHSYKRGGPVFGFISPDRTPEELALIKYTQSPYAVFGFEDAYRAANVPVDERESMGTREYLLTKGGRGITLECGQHEDQEGADIAYMAILNCLSGYGLAELSIPLPQPTSAPHNPLFIQMKHAIFKEKPGGLERPWENFAEVHEGDVLATYEDGTSINSPCDGVIVLPDIRDDMPVGEQWFYIGIKTEL